MLVRHLRNNRQKAIVVFDKGSGEDLPLGRRNPRLKVLFAPQESSADAIIIDMIKRDPNPKGLTVVSSDNEIRRCARSRRARLRSSEDFAKQLESEPKRPRTRTSEDGDLDHIDVAEWIDFFKKGQA
jgi:predicted RNA-binding protein with PIN domain